MHNHGNHSSAVNDGQPDSLLIATGGSRTYIYDGLEQDANQRVNVQFYHDHRMDVTGRNVWMGLTGMYIVDDPADPPTLPSGAFDLPLAVADRKFDANDQIPYVFEPNGVTGDKILINGVYQQYLEVGDRKYRLRILDASNARWCDQCCAACPPASNSSASPHATPSPDPAAASVIHSSRRWQNIPPQAQISGGRPTPISQHVEERVD